MAQPKASLQDLLDALTLDLLTNVQAKKLTLVERLKIFDVLMRAYYPVAQAQKILNEGTSENLLNRLQSVLEDKPKA